ncbi:terminase large subunit [Barrientosiimonas marina]|uniref:Terminase large subunit n=1 Tax=Lentibacillus kimchii TaxID=1542911 RepID=A0ABW2V214_9BACI
MSKVYLKDNPIITYYQQIKSGDVTVSKKVRKVYEHLVEDIVNNPDSNYEYDHNKASHAIEFIERFCKHSKGAMGGKPLILELWQKALVASMFGIVSKETGLRKYRQVMLIVGRKNGKSALSSAVGLYLMVADGESGSEIVSVATKREQAKIIFEEAKSMVKKSPVLKRRIKTRVADLTSGDHTFKPVGRDSDSLDGLNLNGALIDEIHAMKTKELFDVISDSTTAREQPMIFLTSTAGTVRNSVYDILFDEASSIINGYEDPDGYKNESILPIIYELDEKKEWTNPDMWYKANPGLGSIKQYSQLQTKVEQAKHNSMLIKNLVCKEFNIRETSTETWLSFEDLNNTDTFDINELQPRYGIAGVDMSQSVDLTAASVLFMIPNDNRIFVESCFFLPRDLVSKKETEDKIPYSQWYKQGLLRLSQGNKIDSNDVINWLIEVQEDKDIMLPYVAYDSWGTDLFVQRAKDTFGEPALLPIIQGKKTLSSPMQNLGASLQKKQINYNNNPIMKWNLSNVSYEQDKNGNIQPSKGNNQRRRIDGFASMLNAYVALENNYDEYLSLI